MMPLLHLAGIAMRFPLPGGRRLHALDGVDLLLPESGSIGIVGESGSGKTTLARIAARLAAPSEGRVLFAGRDLAAVPLRRFGRDPARAAIRMVFQDAGEALNPAYSAARSIAMGLGRLRPRGEVLARVRATARDVGLGADLLGRRPHQLSGGQRTRVDIARALISRPRLLVLDEPTASLDVSAQAMVLHLLDAARRTQGMAFLFVSHDLNVVRLMCREVMVLYLGRVAEAGPAEAVLRRPLHPYTRLLVASQPGGAGAVPPAADTLSPIDRDGGACLFHNRCDQATERCRRERPALRTVAPGRQVACHALNAPAAC